MSTDLKWHKFFFNRWANDNTIKVLSIEQVGAYWTLLVSQMQNGCIPEEPELLARDFLKGMDLQYFLDHIWITKMEKTSLSKKFTAVPDKPGYLYNVTLAEIMIDDKDYKGKLSEAGKRGQKIKTERSMEKALAEIESEQVEQVEKQEQEVIIDFTSLWKAFPKRKSPKEGFTEGIRLIRDTITTQEQYDLLMAAIKNYAKECRGEDPQFTMKLSKFMTKWGDYVPDNALKTGSDPVDVNSPEAMAKLATIKPAPPAPMYATGRLPPWEIPMSTPKEQAAHERYWTADRKRRYLAGEDVSTDTKEVVSNV